MELDIRRKGFSLKKALKRCGLYFIVSIICIIVFFPIYWMFMTSILPDNKLLTYPPQLFPTFQMISFKSYSRVFAERPIFRWVLNSLFVTFFTTISAMVVSILSGYGLSRYRSAESKIMGYLMLVTRMLPGSLLAIPLYLIFIRIGLINNLFSLVIANVIYIIPFGTWMMKGFFDTIPYELEEAAHIDGCSIIGALLRIVIPCSAPGIAAVSIYCAIMSWSEYLYAKTFMSGGENFTLTVGAATFIGEMEIHWNDLMAVSLIGTIPLLIAFLKLEKYLVSGMTGGAVKE